MLKEKRSGSCPPQSSWLLCPEEKAIHTGAKVYRYACTVHVHLWPSLAASVHYGVLSGQRVRQGYQQRCPACDVRGHTKDNCLQTYLQLRHAGD